MYRLQIEPQDALDAVWFERLQEVTRGNREIFLMLEPTPEALSKRRQEFADSNYSIDLDLRPAHLEVGQINSINQRLQQLSNEIEAGEENQYIREAYLARIDELITGNKMALAAAAGDDEAFADTNRHLYGIPDKDIFADCLAWIRQDTQATPTEAFPELARLQMDLLAGLPPVPGGDPLRLMPDEKTFHEVRELHRVTGGYRDQLFGAERLPEVAYIEQEMGDAICKRVIENIGSDFTVAESTDGIWAVLQSTKQVIRPSGYRLDLDEFSGIVCHEIGGHLLESANGSRQPLRLLQIGLAKFEAGNEGRAYLREQIVYNSEAEFTHQSSWEYILMLYLGVCLAAGMYEKPYTFSELYQLMYSLHAFWRERRFPRATNNILSAREEAWHLTVRVLKGTGAKRVAGANYLKDIVYLEGNIACWDIARRDPAMILLGDVGKFNIASSEHIAILRGLGILAE